MKRSEEIRREIEIKENVKSFIEAKARRETTKINFEIMKLNRELNDIRDGGKLDEEI